MSFDRLRAAKRPREEAFLSPVTLAFSLSIARICTDERRVRNSILTHTALYRYQPAEQSPCRAPGPVRQLVAHRLRHRGWRPQLVRPRILICILFLLRSYSHASLLSQQARGAWDVCANCIVVSMTLCCTGTIPELTGTRIDTNKQR
jgi:hypothetical protein